MPTMTPYFNFRGTTRDAMEFYRSVLGGELAITTYAEGGAVEAGSPHADEVMHAQLQSEHLKLYASDWVAEFCGDTGLELRDGDDVHVTLEGPVADAEFLREAYRKLAEGGTVFMELGMQDWGDEFGSLKDRFGKSWNIAIAVASAGDAQPA